MLKSLQFILPCSYGTFTAIQLPLLHEEPLLQLDNQCLKEKKPYTKQQVEISVKKRSKPRKSPT
jgi:hypothetical protein